MGLIASMSMITVGAIMRFAVSAQAEGFSVHQVGVILMIVGILGAVMSIVFWASWGGFGNRTTVRSSAPAAPARVVSEQTVVERSVS